MEWLFIFTFLLSGAAGIEPQLQIFPVQEEQVKPVGKSVLLTCQAHADDVSLISDHKWLDNRNIPIDQNNRFTRDRFQVNTIGPQKLALIISTLREMDSGNYTCVATYQSAQKISKVVTLKTYVAVTWEDAPEDQYPRLGEDYKVKCKVTANPAPHVDWLINGGQVPKDPRYVMETDGLLIKNVQATDDGIYTCRAFVMDTGDLQKRDIKVEVHTPPKFKDDMPTSHEVVEGESASIACAAEGKPAPKYTWIRASTQQNLGIASDRFTVNELTGVLNILRVTKDDNGDFKCIANNGAGSVEKDVHFVVIIKPQIAELKNITFKTDDEAIMECRVTGNPVPTITFRKLSSRTNMLAGLQPDDERITVQQQERERGIAVGILTISSLKRSDDGLYACIAKNKGGEATKNGHLTVQFPPTFENTPIKEAWSWDRKPVNLTCSAESIPNATISWWLNNRNIDKDVNYQKFGNGPTSVLLVTPISRSDYGVYKCIARNLHGEAFHEIILREASIPSEILQAKVEVITATTITFSFSGPASNGGRPIKAFIVDYKEGLQTWNEARNKTWAYGSSYILEGLKPQVQYQFRFAAVNEVGPSPWGAHQHQTMPKRSSPEEPPILNDVPEEGYVESTYPNKYELRWKKPADNGEYIDEYEIKWCTVHRENDVWADTEPGCNTHLLKSTELTSMTITNLQPGTFYKVEIRAHNAIGYSSPGQIVLHTPRDNSIGMYHNENTPLSSSLLISLVVGALCIILIIIDVSCYFVHETGILWLICGKKKSRTPREEDAKMSSEGKGLLNNGNRDSKIRIDATEDGFKRDTTVEYDIKRSISRTSFAGKNSAV